MYKVLSLILNGLHLFFSASTEELRVKAWWVAEKGGSQSPSTLIDLTWSSSSAEGYCLPWSINISCDVWPHCFTMSFLRFCLAFKNTLHKVNITFEPLVDVGNTGSIRHPARPGFTCRLGISRNANDGRAATTV